MRLNETDGIVGGGQSAFWLSLCCDERMHHAPFDSCFKQTAETVIQISAGSKFFLTISTKRPRLTFVHVYWIEHSIR